MSIRKVFESHLAEQRGAIARMALKQALRGGIPGGTRLKDVFDQIREDDQLWQEFQDLRLDEFKALIAPPAAAYGPPGPTRKRGVTSNRIVDFVRQNPGARRSDIMEALGLKGGTVSSQLRGLRATGKLRSEGPERNLLYFAG